jgi:hypothetical protein
VGAEIETVRFDHFARDCSRVGNRKRVQESQVGLLQANPQRVAIDDFESRNRGVVVELAGLRGLGACFVAAYDLAVDEPCPGALDGRVER